MRIGERRFRVIGVLAKKGQSLGLDISDLAVIPVASAEALFNRSSLFRILVQAKGRDSIERAKKGEIVLGGCVVGPIAAVCPYCRWPARFCNPTRGLPAVDLTEAALEGLSPIERQEVKRYVQSVLGRAQFDMEEHVTAIHITQTDVWVGTVHHGLHRLDRIGLAWQSYDRRTIGGCVRRIWQHKGRICVAHDTIGNHTFFYTNFSADLPPNRWISNLSQYSLE